MPTTTPSGTTWRRSKKTRSEKFFEKNVGRVPVAVRIDAANPLQACRLPLQRPGLRREAGAAPERESSSARASMCLPKSETASRAGSRGRPKIGQREKQNRMPTAARCKRIQLVGQRWKISTPVGRARGVVFVDGRPVGPALQKRHPLLRRSDAIDQFSRQLAMLVVDEHGVEEERPVGHHDQLGRRRGAVLLTRTSFSDFSSVSASLPGSMRRGQFDFHLCRFHAGQPLLLAGERADLPIRSSAADVNQPQFSDLGRSPRCELMRLPGLGQAVGGSSRPGPPAPGEGPSPSTSGAASKSRPT